MERHLLEERLAEMSVQTGMSFDHLRQQWDILAALPPEQRMALNPHTAAEELGMSAQEATSFFLAGVRAGVFRQNWSVFSPESGWVLAAASGLGELNGQAVLDPFSERWVEPDLDRNVCVTFSPADVFFDERIDSFGGSLKEYKAVHYFNGFHEKPEFTLWNKARMLGFHVFSGYELGRVPLQLIAGEVYRIINLETCSYFTLIVSGRELAKDATFYEKMVYFKEVKQTSSQEIQTFDLELSSQGFSHKQGEMHPGRAVVWVQNRLSTPAAVFVYKLEAAAQSKMKREFPPEIGPFLSGRALLHHHQFRRMVMASPLPEGLRIKVSDLTILFVNIKGSTTILDRMGDSAAHDFLEEKLARLADLTAEGGGFLVKTISDKIVASFPDPLSAVKTAWKMFQRDGTDSESPPLSFKVGINSGSALLVKSNNQVDFFGRMVNIAAKLQALAQADTLWVSMGVFSHPGVADYLQGIRAACVQQVVTLKGDDQKSIAYECTLDLPRGPSEPGSETRDELVEELA